MPRWATFPGSKVPRPPELRIPEQVVQVKYVQGPYSDRQELLTATVVENELTPPASSVQSEKTLLQSNSTGDKPHRLAQESKTYDQVQNQLTEPVVPPGETQLFIQVDEDLSSSQAPVPEIQSISHDGTDISVTVFSDNPALSEPTEYRLYRSRKKNGLFQQIASITDPSNTEAFTDSNVAQGTDYWYKAKTVISSGKDSIFSDLALMRIGVVDVKIRVFGDVYLTSDISGFPVFVPGSVLTDAFWENVSSGGDGIRVFDGGGNQIPREVVSVNTGPRIGEVHFEAPSISASSPTDFILRAGTGKSAPSTTDPNGRNSVWSNGYEAVYHLQSTGTAKDSTGSGFGATVNGGTLANGQLAKALSLDGTSDWADIGDFDSLDLVNQSISAWVKPSATAVGNEQSAVSKSGSQTDSWGLFESSGNFEGRANDGANSETLLAPAETDKWQLLHQTYNGSALRLYKNGSEESSSGALSGDLLQNTNPVAIGRHGDLNEWYLNGVVDEVRLQSVARSAEWVNAEWVNQSTPLDFFSIVLIEGPNNPPSFDSKDDLETTKYIGASDTSPTFDERDSLEITKYEIDTAPTFDERDDLELTKY